MNRMRERNIGALIIRMGFLEPIIILYSYIKDPLQPLPIIFWVFLTL